MVEILTNLVDSFAVIIKPIFDIVADIVGTIGVIVLTMGVIKAVWSYLKKPNLWRARVILVEHILFGLDFLIVRDIIESITLKTNMLIMDLGALVLMVAVRVIFSFFTSKEMEELLEEKKDRPQISRKPRRFR